MSKYGVISRPHFLIFSPDTGKYGQEITPYLDTFHAVKRKNISGIIDIFENVIFSDFK